MRKVGELIRNQKDWEEMKEGDVVEFVGYKDGHTHWHYVQGGNYQVINLDGEIGPANINNNVPRRNYEDTFTFKYVSLVDESNGEVVQEFKVGDMVVPNGVRAGVGNNHHYGTTQRMKEWENNPFPRKVQTVCDSEVYVMGYGYHASELKLAETEEKEIMNDLEFDMKKLEPGTLITAEDLGSLVIVKSIDDDQDYTARDIDGGGIRYIHYSDIDQVHGQFSEGVLFLPDDMNIPRKPSYEPSVGDILVTSGGTYLVKQDGLDGDGDIDVLRLYGEDSGYIDPSDVKKVIGKISPNGLFENYEN